MYKFGPTPPRSLESFGVSGLLGENCWVFYNTLFTTRHVGRISDLLSARLKDAGGDELKLRALTLFTIFEAYHAQTGDAGVLPLAEPVVVECGVDGEKIAIGVAFTLPQAAVIETQGLRERVMKNAPEGSFETRVADLMRHSNRVVLRMQPAIRRVEIVSVIGIPGKMDAQAMSEAPQLEIIVLQQNPQETPKAQSYVELGDLDYPKLLSDEQSGTGASAREDFHIVEGKELGAALLSKKTIKGVTQNLTDGTVTRIAGATDQEQDESLIRIAGATGAAAEAASASQTQLYLDRIEQLQKKIAALEEERAGATFVVKGAPQAASDETEIVIKASPEIASEEEEEDDEEVEEAAPRALIKRIWPFKRKEAEAVEEEDDEDEDESDDSDEDSGEAAEVVETDPAVAAEAPAAAPVATDPAADAQESPLAEAARAVQSVQSPTVNAEAAAKSLAMEIQAGSLDRTISKAQKEAADLKKELGSAKAKRWVDGLMTDLVAEKSRLQDLAKKAQTTVRQKELEFRNKDQAFQEELRRRDELLKQKNSALMRAKEQLAQVNMNLERFKAAAATSGSSEDPHLKTKFAHAQKLLLATKEENAALSAKVEELRAAVGLAQANAIKSKGPTFAEHQALQQKLERVARLAEEFRRQNQALMEKVGDAKKDPAAKAATNMDDLKKRFDAAMKLVTLGKKESEKLTLRIEELQRDEMLLKRELQMAQAELKNLKAARGGTGSGTGTGTAA